jgi:uncharacterized protein
MAQASKVISNQGKAESAAPVSHVVENQDEVFRFLADPATHGLDRDVKRIDTHGAAVFLAGTEAYKVKRAVRFQFMDFSTINKRWAACEAEITVNRPNAPEVYLGTLPVVRREGALHLGGEGEVVEWVVHMRRFDESLTLDRIAARDALTPELVLRIAATVADSHARAPLPTGVDFATALHSLIDENCESLHETPAIFDSARVEALTVQSCEALRRTVALLRQRALEGLVRRCHGDLHLRNLVLLDGVPTLFDAIEFNEALATTDVLYDLAFLLMDVAERGLRFEANLLLNRYLAECGNDRHFAGLAALPLFLSVRAAIRAKVTAAGLDHAEAAQRDALVAEAQRYCAFAETALEPVVPRLVAIGGLSGTGKSTLAARLAPEIGRLPGAVHLRSDLERKRLLGAPEFELLPASAYGRATTEAVYRALYRKAEMVLGTGYSVIVDAVHQRAEERSALIRLAERRGVGFAGLWLEAPIEVLIRRVGGRKKDASDGDAEVVAMQAQRATGEIDWHYIDASSDPDTVLGHVRVALARTSAIPTG